MLSKFNAARGSIPYRQVAALLFAFLWGCGGGGGGGGGSAGGGPAPLTQPPSTPVAVTAANANQVAATALEPAIGGAEALDVVLGVETTAAPKSSRAVTHTLRAVARDTKKRLSAPRTVVGVVTTEPCAVSGSVTVDDNGTSATVTFNACTEVAGETLSGSASATGIVETASSFAANFALDVTFTETGVAPLRVAGGFSISETCAVVSGIATNDCTGNFTGTSLGAVRGNETWFITNFTITEAQLGAIITTTANFTVSSSALNGSVTVITSTPLLTLTTANHPHAGVVVATGSGNSKVRVTVLGSNPTAANQVRIEVDANGDGTFEVNTLFPWSTLDAL